MLSAGRAGLAGMFVLGLLAGGLGVQMWHLRGNLPQRHLEATVFVPLVDNGDRPLSPEKWQEAVEPLLTRFGGATLGAPVEGCWSDQHGTLRREPVRPVVVSFTAGRMGEFRRVLHEVGRRLGQEAMYVRFEEPFVELLTVDQDGTLP